MTDGPAQESRHPGDDRPRRGRGMALRVAAFLIVFWVLLMILERQMLFFPTKHPGGLSWTPEEIAVEDVWFETSDGVKLHGWYLPHPDPTAYILYCHGNAGNITHRAEPLRSLNEKAGAAVFLFDYRGYGRSEGLPSETGLYRDARAARKKLAELGGVDESEVVLLGRSLGGAVAVELAAKDGAKALVVESSFTSIPDMARRVLPWLPVGPFIRNRFESIRKIDRYGGPVLISHGHADSVVPYEHGEKLFEAANEPKQFFPIEGRDHNDPQPDEYYETLKAFLTALQPRR